jgi:DnaJ-domain-containing protein 1
MVCGECFGDYTLPEAGGAGVRELLLCSTCGEELGASAVSEDAPPASEPRTDEAPEGEDAPPAARDVPPPSSPWEVLGVAPGTPLSEVKRVYLALITQYHPDKVAQLGPKLQALATEETRRLNEAWSELRRRAC